jgi:U2-associated protein SR140
MGEEKEKFVRAVADRVRAHGNRFEQVLRDREKGNEKFAFLRNVDVRTKPWSLCSVETCKLM